MIALGSDHGGFELKREIANYLTARGIPSADYGTSCVYETDQLPMGDTDLQVVGCFMC